VSDSVSERAPRRWQRLVDALLTTEPLQRMRLAQAWLAILLMATGVVAMHYFVWAGMAPAAPVRWWSLLSLGGMIAFFVLIRSGRTRRAADPSLTLPQMVFSLLSGAAAYALVGAGRGGVFPIVMVVLAFGLFQLRPQEVRLISVFAVGLFGAVMALMAWLRPAVYVPAVEFGHFLMVATMMPAMSVLAGRLCHLRERLRERKDELAQALARIRELATRDELTGLVNRRHLLELLEQEHQRCVRSGHTFCLAVIAVDRFRDIGDRYGHPTGDELLRDLAREMLAVMRVSDVLARWGGECFVMLLSDARAAQARPGVERLREQVLQQPADFGDGPLAVTLSAGLAEHHAGETVAQTLARAERALDEAKAQGGDRVVTA